MLNSLPDDLGFWDVYRVVGEFRRRKLEIRLNYSDDVIDRLSSPSSVARLIAESSQLLEAQMTYEHEMTHWYQQIGTAYGYLQLQADDCSARLMSGYFGRY